MGFSAHFLLRKFCVANQPKLRLTTGSHTIHPSFLIWLAFLQASLIRSTAKMPRSSSIFINAIKSETLFIAFSDTL